MESGAEVRDPYAILQVNLTAEPEVIEAAYKKLAQKYHPDRNIASDSNHRMQDINWAYSVLQDPVQRSEYDRHTKRDETANSDRQPTVDVNASWEAKHESAENLETQIETAISQNNYNLAKQLLDECAKIWLEVANELELKDSHDMKSVEFRARGKYAKERLHPELATPNQVKPPANTAEIVTFEGRLDYKASAGYGFRLINRILEVEEEFMGRENAYNLGCLSPNQWVGLKNLMGEQLPVYLRQNGVVLQALVGPPPQSSLPVLGVCDYSREWRFQMQPNCLYAHPEGRFSIYPVAKDAEPYKNIRLVMCSSAQENTPLILHGLPSREWHPVQLPTGSVFPIKIYITNLTEEFYAGDIFGAWLPLGSTSKNDFPVESANQSTILIGAGIVTTAITGIGLLVNWLAKKSNSR